MPFHNPYHFVPVRRGGRLDDLSKNDFVANSCTSHSQVTHDRYVTSEKTEQPVAPYSGRIVVQITAEGSLVVGSEQTRENENAPTIVKQFTIGEGVSERPAIPASTIRGLIGNIFETATNSSLRVLENQTYSRRAEASPQEALNKVGMIELDNTTDRLVMRPFETMGNPPIGYVKIEVPPTKVIPRGSIKTELRYIGRAATSPAQLADTITRTEFDALPEEQKANYRPGLLRVMADVNRKKGPPNNDGPFDRLNRRYELFLFWPPGTPIPISDAAIRRYHLLADLMTNDDDPLPRPFETIGRTPRNNQPGKLGKKIRLRPADLVYYRTNPTGTEVIELSFSAIWRKLIPDNATPLDKADTTFDFFRKIDPDLLPFNKDRHNVTIAEQLFGFVESNPKESSDNDNQKVAELSLAGRIFPSNAIFRGIKNDQDGWIQINSLNNCLDINTQAGSDGYWVLKALSSPKPPSPALYFKKRGDGYILKKELNAHNTGQNQPPPCQPKGRKFYLHDNTNNGRPWKTNAGPNDENLKLKMKVKPVRKGAVFHFHIDFFNLSENELNALIYSLRPTEAFRHKIGLGKPIGLGAIRIDPAALYLIDRKDRYSADGLSAARYQWAWRSTTEGIECPAELYEDESALDSNLEGNALEPRRAAFALTVPHEIKIALETLGDPSNVQHPVHYPAVTHNGLVNTEGEHFKWFVANDKGSGIGPARVPRAEEQLKSITESGNIPTLTKHPWVGN